MSYERFDHLCTTMILSAVMIAVGMVGYKILDMLMAMAECTK